METNNKPLSKAQIEALLVLNEYPNDIVMYDGWLTGGHGRKLNLNTVSSLTKRGLIEKEGTKRGRISEEGKIQAKEALARIS